MALEIQVLIWNKHKNVVELNELLGYQLLSDHERGNDYGPLRPHHHNIQWAISV